MKNILLFGGGTHAGYVIDVIQKEGKYQIIGIIDSIADIGTEKYGFKILGRQENVKEIVDEFSIYGGIIAIGDNWSRYKVRECILNQIQDFKFLNAIHPSTIIGNNVKIGTGIVIMAGCIINPHATVGDFCFFATGAQIEHDCIVNDFASVSAGTITGGKVDIGKFSALTLGVIVLDRIKIGENTVIGSGSLVTKDVPSNVLAYGRPAVIIRKRNLGEKFLKS